MINVNKLIPEYKNHNHQCDECERRIERTEEHTVIFVAGSTDSAEAINICNGCFPSFMVKLNNYIHPLMS